MTRKNRTLQMPGLMKMENNLEELQQQLDNFVVHKPLIFSRVVGYFQPIQQWNDGKIQEWKERKKYIIKHDN